MNKSSYRDLKIWRESFNIGITLYKKIKDFPVFEQYSLCDQMRRCIISITSNIAEGHARNSNKEFIHFLSISRGSIAELETQILMAIELGYLNRELGESIIYTYNGIDIMIVKMMKAIKTKNNPLSSLKSFLLSFLSF